MLFICILSDKVIVDCSVSANFVFICVLIVQPVGGRKHALSQVKKSEKSVLSLLSGAHRHSVRSAC